MRYLMTLLLLAIPAPTAYAQWDWHEVFINPGIKVGGTSGAKGGFTIGFELSVTRVLDNGFVYGAVLNYDIVKGGRRKLHFGLEGGYLLVGVETGPTLVFGEGDSRFGWTVTPYAGLFFYPFYSITTLPDETIDEWGLYLKLPFRADGEELVGGH